MLIYMSVMHSRHVDDATSCVALLKKPCGRNLFTAVRCRFALWMSAVLP